MQHTVYLFDRFQLDVTRRKLLSASGLVLPLNSRAMEALLLLVANAGKIIDKRRLMQTLWPDTIVEDNNLNQCILAIRKALGETAGSNRFVMTVQGRGFCFVCPVHVRVQESADEIAAARPPFPHWTSRPPRAPMRIASGQPAERIRRRERKSFLLGMALGAIAVAALLLPFALH